MRPVSRYSPHGRQKRKRRFNGGRVVRRLKAGFQILTVSQLNFYVRSIVDGDENLHSLFLRGEISNFKNYERSGHYYMTLKDDRCAVKAVMFRTSAASLRFMPRDGMKVIVMGRASLYERDGQFQFYIDDMQPDGEGALYLAFQQLKEKLRAEGLFDETRKKSLPPYPERIGVATSPSGAVLHDIKNVLERRWPVAKIVFCPCAVQGDDAPRQLIAAVDMFNKQKNVDVIICARGGGSIEDLWAFNNEALARRIASSAIPVVSAVGHETDFTIADFAADLRAPTPSAAAELVSPDLVEVLSAVRSEKLYIQKLMSAKIDGCRSRFRNAAEKRVFSSPLIFIEDKGRELDAADMALRTAMKDNVEKRERSFSVLAARLEMLSPLKVLARGYAAAFDKNGNTIGRAALLSPGDRFSLQFQDGRAVCRAEKLIADENGALSLPAQRRKDV